MMHILMQLPCRQLCGRPVLSALASFQIIEGTDIVSCQPFPPGPSFASSAVS